MVRKLPRNMDNPIDTILIDIAEYLCPFFKRLGFTPNGITTLSLIFGVLAVYYLYKGCVMTFGVLYFISYFFDCMDGHFARKYKMVTKYGDLYDHVKDLLVVILIFSVVMYRNFSCSFKNILIASILLSILVILINVHMGCQETIYDKDNVKNESHTLDWTKKLCPSPDFIYISRFFGCGTVIILLIAIIIWIEKKNKLCHIKSNLSTCR
jgi:hypothetical protein